MTGLADARFSALGSSVALQGPREWVEPISRGYERFAAPPDGPAIRVSWRPGDASCRIGDEHAPWLRAFDGATQFYNHFLGTLLDGVRGHAVLHGAAGIDSRGGAFLLAAPSGCGKSSLMAGLVDAGARVLSDDFAPFALDTGRIAPWPRRFALDAEGIAPIPARARDAAARGEVRWMGKSWIDPAAVWGPGTWADAPSPIRRVFLLRGSSGPAGGGRFEFVAAAGRRDAWRRAFASREDVGWRHDRVDGDRWSAVLEHPADTEVTAVLDAWGQDRATVYCRRSWSGESDFDADPVLNAIPIREAALRLGREWMNRRERSVLMREIPGGLPEAFFLLGSALAGVRTYELVVGNYTRTLEILADRILD